MQFMHMQFTIHWLQGASDRSWEMLLKDTVRWNSSMLEYSYFLTQSLPSGD